MKIIYQKKLSKISNSLNGVVLKLNVLFKNCLCLKISNYLKTVIQRPVKMYGNTGPGSDIPSSQNYLVTPQLEVPNFSLTQLYCYCFDFRCLGDSSTANDTATKQAGKDFLSGYCLKQSQVIRMNVDMFSISSFEIFILKKKLC